VRAGEHASVNRDGWGCDLSDLGRDWGSREFNDGTCAQILNSRRYTRGTRGISWREKPKRENRREGGRNREERH